MAHVVGDIHQGKLADLVLWKPENFGIKPDTIVKGGVISWSQARPKFLRFLRRDTDDFPDG